MAYVKASLGDIQSRSRLKCANPTCTYRIHSNPEFGGFCCKRCHETPGAHGKQCQRNSDIEFCETAPPEPPEPIRNSQGKKSLNASRQEQPEPEPEFQSAPPPGTLMQRLEKEAQDLKAFKLEVKGFQIYCVECTDEKQEVFRHAAGFMQETTEVSKTDLAREDLHMEEPTGWRRDLLQSLTRRFGSDTQYMLVEVLCGSREGFQAIGVATRKEQRVRASNLSLALAIARINDSGLSQYSPELQAVAKNVNFRAVCIDGPVLPAGPPPAKRIKQDACMWNGRTGQSDVEIDLTGAHDEEHVDEEQLAAQERELRLMEERLNTLGQEEDEGNPYLSNTLEASDSETQQYANTDHGDPLTPQPPPPPPPPPPQPYEEPSIPRAKWSPKPKPRPACASRTPEKHTPPGPSSNVRLPSTSETDFEEEFANNNARGSYTIEVVPVDHVRYLQDSIKKRFCCGRPLEDLIGKLINRDPSCIPGRADFLTLEAMRYQQRGSDPILYSINNRRLHCLKKFQELTSETVLVKLKVYVFDDAHVRFLRNFTTGNAGETISVRGQGSMG